MRSRFLWCFVLLGPAFAVALVHGESPTQEPVRPTEVIRLFNGKDLTGLSPWLKKTGRKDPDRVFSVQDGVIHVSGTDAGYLATEKPYKDYRVLVEYKWGKEIFGSKYVRNSGLLLNGVGPDGGASGVWMSSIECQLAQGCVGDLIPVRGKNAKGGDIPVTFTAATALGSDRRPRWKKGGEAKTFTNRQLWWSLHESGFKEFIDTRGKDDVESPLGEWTRVECVSSAGRITVKINGVTVNECYDAYPLAGKLLLQSEGFEVFFRNFELRPLGRVD